MKTTKRFAVELHLELDLGDGLGPVLYCNEKQRVNASHMVTSSRGTFEGRKIGRCPKCAQKLENHKKALLAEVAEIERRSPPAHVG